MIGSPAASCTAIPAEHLDASVKEPLLLQREDTSRIAIYSREGPDGEEIANSLPRDGLVIGRGSVMTSAAPPAAPTRMPLEGSVAPVQTAELANGRDGKRSARLEPGGR
jgi:hypothetical protein